MLRYANCVMNVAAACLAHLHLRAIILSLVTSEGLHEALLTANSTSLTDARHSGHWGIKLQ